MNECLMTAQCENEISYLVSDKKYLYEKLNTPLKKIKSFRMSSVICVFVAIFM